MSCSQKSFSWRISSSGEVWNCILPFFKVLPFKIGYLIISSLLFRYSIFKDLSTLQPLAASEWYLVGTNGLEPSTSRLSGVRSNHLSYAPIFTLFAPYLPLLVEIKGIEPLTPCLQSRCSPSWAKPPVVQAPSKLNNTELLQTIVTGPYSSLERRWSSRTFRYGYLVTT